MFVKWFKKTQFCSCHTCPATVLAMIELIIHIEFQTMAWNKSDSMGEDRGLGDGRDAGAKKKSEFWAGPGVPENKK